MKKLYLLSIVFLFAISCAEQKQSEDISTIAEKEELKIDLNQVKDRGVLKALIVYSPSDYFLYKGEEMGFEYELMKNYAESQNLALELIRVNNIDSIIPKLLAGEGDVIAHGMSITKARRDRVLFTNYHNITHQMLIQRKPDNWRNMTLDEIDAHLVKNVIELLGDTVSVRKKTSYYSRLQNIMEETGGEIYIDTLEGNISTEQIIQMVAQGDLKFTIADNNLASLSAYNYDILDARTQVSLDQALSWCVRKDSPLLAESINKWIKEIKKSGYYNIIYQKYYNKNVYRNMLHSDLFTLKTGKISKYDNIIKKYSTAISWDWRLVSALVYQESRFDHNSKSWVGAHGLMQIMPSTAKSLGIKNQSPEENIKAGTKYLYEIYQRWENIKDNEQRIKFTLASYNCGIGHIQDAQALAKSLNTDPLTWDNSVENCLLKLSEEKYYNSNFVNHGYVRGIETYNYVKEIFLRYKNYQEFVVE